MRIPINLPEEKLWKWIDSKAKKKAKLMFKKHQRKNASLSTGKREVIKDESKGSI